MNTITAQQKTQDIPQAIAQYLQEKNTDQAQLARISKVGASYINHIVQGKMAIKNKNGETLIKDKYYIAICEAIDYPLIQKVWRHFDTYNFGHIITKIKGARRERIRTTIDGDTGAGKSYACHAYSRRYPDETYVVTCSALENSKEFAVNIGETVGVEVHGTGAAIIKRTIKKLLEKDNPMLIIDEAEHCEKKQGYINVLKALSDGLDKKIGFVLIGMGINDILQKGYDKKKQNFRQTARRFRKREQCLDSITDDIENICEQIGLTSKRVQSWLKARVENFGDLENIIRDAFEESQKSGQEIDTKLLNELYL